jgi:hypothetical protein
MFNLRGVFAAQIRGKKSARPLTPHLCTANCLRVHTADAAIGVHAHEEPVVALFGKGLHAQDFVS